MTGCSTGIGRATAITLARRGWPVHATARRPETIADLAEHGCRLARLDVCDEASMTAVVESITQTHGAVGVLVNNAGYGLEGPVEELSLGDVRGVIETNLLGALRLSQLVLPGMRAQHWGRIVNVSSVAGRIVLPGGGAYHASKHALEAISDALRFEVRGFGVRVVVVEPGAIPTRWTEKAMTTLDSEVPSDSPYRELREAIAQRLMGAHEGLLARFAGSADDVAAVIGRAIEAERPRARYVVPRSSLGFVAAGRHLPDRVWDAVLRRLYPTPRARS